MKNKKDKKAISPLIATVLLLGFTVALAAIIMTWGQSFTKNMQKSTEQASNTQLTCATDVIFDVKSVCGDASNVRITIANNGEKDIKSLTLRFYKDISTVASVQKIGVNITGFNIKTVEIPIASTPELGAAGITQTSDIKKVEAIPTILINNAEVVCSSNIIPLGDVDSPTGFATC